MANQQNLDTGAGGLFFTQAQPSAPAPTPAPTPAPRVESPAPAYTTQDVQGAAEYVTAGEVTGGETYVPFGPALTLNQSDGQIADPGFSWQWVEGVPRRTFRIAHSIGLMPLLRFAFAAKQGADSDDMEGLAALYTMIRDCVLPEDWEPFQLYAIDTRADDEDLMEFVQDAMAVISARPPKPRGSSSATSRSTSPRSKGSSSPQATAIPPGATVPPEAAGLMPVSGLVS